MPDVMDLPAEPGADAADEPAEEPTGRSWGTLLGRIAVVSIVLGIAIMWMFAFWGKFDVPGRMADQTFPHAAAPVCQATVDQIEALPKAFESKTAAERADVVDQGSAYLDTMLATLRTKLPAADPERSEVTQWLADWATYVKDRRDYTAQLRVDPMTRFAVTQSDRDKSQITNGVDNFAKVNDMAPCATPDDLS